ncbi:hypothetical protein [Inquilinus sp.]|jgi:hypothetical protein|uniref:hypothetical protein n=1 Tax=Inquilinus sp. TaxID=1932117 RepID=UPI0037851530
MRWILIAIVAVIGVLGIVLPQVMHWNPEMMQTATGMGIGCLVSAVGLVIVPMLGKAFFQVSGGSSSGVTAIGGARFVFNEMSWVDWLVLVVPVFGGFLIGMLI